MHGHHRAGASVAAVLAAAALSLAVASPTQAALPPGFADDPVVTGLSVPRDLAFLPSGDILVIENEGLVKVVESGAARELLDLRAAVRVSGEQGLLGVAVDPDFPGRPYAYFHYTADETPGHVRLSRFTFLNASGPGPLGIDPSSELVFLGDIPDDAFNHNGGTVRFGPDKRLYMSIGEDAD
ncbi:MAG TPA: PQQ-dependent sugar dehydrogenase, partial [Candidatus Thermoplasmatota archaeon]